MEDIDFSPDEYRLLLRTLKTAGYGFAAFGSRLNDAQAILRHDVDYSMKYAAYIGAIEAEEGCHATYFVLLATEFYNLHSREGRRYLRELQSLGHRVGLHFDRSAYDGGLNEHQVAAQRECEVLENLLGEEVTVTAFHRPAQTPEVLGMAGLFAGRVHAYSPEYFTDIAYVSEGAGFWSHGSPFEQDAFQRGAAIHILTHPYLWVHQMHGTARDRIERFRRERESFLVSELHRNLRYYSDGGS